MQDILKNNAINNILVTHLHHCRNQCACFLVRQPKLIRLAKELILCMTIFVMRANSAKASFTISLLLHSPAKAK